MKTIELTFTDKQYAMLLAESILETGSENNLSELIVKMVERSYNNTGFMEFDKIIQNNYAHIAKINRIITVLKDKGLEKFAIQISCEDEELKPQKSKKVE